MQKYQENETQIKREKKPELILLLRDNIIEALKSSKFRPTEKMILKKGLNYS